MSAPVGIRAVSIRYRLALARRAGGSWTMEFWRSDLVAPFVVVFLDRGDDPWLGQLCGHAWMTPFFWFGWLFALGVWLWLCWLSY
jgi:hypothetical protein